MSIYTKTFNFAAGLLFSSSIFSTAVLAAETNATAAPAPAAQEAAKPETSIEKMDPNTTLVTVNNEKITLGDILDARKNLPEQYKTLPVQVLLPTLLNQLAMQSAIYQHANTPEVTNSAEFKQHMDMARKEITIAAYQEQELKKSLEQKPVDAAAIQTYYHEHYANKPPVKEAHIRHILVKSEPEAKKIIAQLHAGKKFNDLAKQYSIDKESSNEKGGDLGWVKENAPFIPEFLKAAFALKANSYTQTPVKTAFGWHVIQVLGYKNDPVPQLHAVENEIKHTLVQERKKEIFSNIMKQTKITPNETAIRSIIPQPQTPAPAAAPAQK